MILGDSKQTFDLTFEDNKIKYSQELKIAWSNYQKQTKLYLTCKKADKDS